MTNSNQQANSPAFIQGTPNPPNNSHVFMNSSFIPDEKFGLAPLPSNFPKTLVAPKYPIGTRCRWIPMPQTDWGTVIGQIYAPEPTTEPETSQWSWVYLLLLDPDSSSRNWVVADWVSEEDLELLPLELPT